MIYFDSSYLFRLYLRGAQTEPIEDFLKSGESIASALHGKTELYSAFHRGFRENVYPLDQIEKMIEQVNSDTQQEYLHWLPITEQTISYTQSVYSTAPSTCFLRGADALHLACARENGFKTVYSNDKHLLAAAPLFGLKGKNII
jgi:predicted nucleic acid-binding protein